MNESAQNPHAQQLQTRIDSRQALVGIIGLGYVGLPLAQAFTTGGYRVLGFDIDTRKVEKIARGESYIGHINNDTIADMVKKGFSATTDFSRLQEADAVLICVPTPLTAAREPDLTYVENSAIAIADTLRPGQLIVLESTTYPGTTRRVVCPILEQAGLKCGKDFFLAFSPEREDPGNKSFSAPTIPKVVGGIDAISGQLANLLYSHAVKKTVPVSSAEIAEASKILENTYRAVNIALVNELKMLYDRMGIDVWEVIEAAKTKPFGYQAFYPGPGLGGHCIPIDPFYLTWVAREYGLSTRFIELAGEINTSMPHYVIERLGNALNDRTKPIRSSRILMLGMAYKKDIDDPRESPGFEIMELLLQKGAQVSYNDPHIPDLPSMRHYPGLKMKSTPLSAEMLRSQDAVLIVTDHSAYDWNMIVEHASLVIDTRNACKDVKSRENIIKA
ncbi:MAG: nucleotide sugar dehydrogenase [Planctomycetia bacterium]|nr:nucleotide sugar dehydrogenase [Planctomycetia bacterium]